MAILGTLTNIGTLLLQFDWRVSVCGYIAANQNGKIQKTTKEP
jgi:hypothetical protein